MSETLEQLDLRLTPLAVAHRRDGATIRAHDGWAVPAHYGDPAAEYRAVREGGAGLFDLSSRGRIEVMGGEAVQFLNGLITNDVKTLEDGAWMLAAFPNVQGRLLAAVRVIRRGPLFIFDTEAATAERVFQTLERFTLAGDFHVRERRDETALLSLQGAGAARLIETLFGAEAAGARRGRTYETEWRGENVMLMRATHTAEDGFDLLMAAAVSTSLWEALKEAGARPCGYEALELLRVEAGVPRYGVDMSEANVVLETGLDEAVSFTKGCYIGQEIIARIHWRGHVAKKLAGLLFEPDAPPVAPESKIKTPEGREVGRLTSCVFSPSLGRTLALGYVKYDQLAAGTSLRVVAGEAERPARVVELPFVRGSWFAASAESGAASGVARTEADEA